MTYAADDYKLTLSTQLQFLLKFLPERNGMTPTYLSRLMMYIVLPATTSVPKDTPVLNLSGYQTNRYMIEGMATIEYLNLISPSSLYTVFFSGNAQDSMELEPFDEKQNYVFWNYPGVGDSLGTVNSSHDLFEAGYQQVKRLIDQEIKASSITLRGLSLGGGIATQVARRLQAEGYPVNLTVDRSFSRLSSVVPALITKELSEIQNPVSAPLVTSVIALTLSGVALGTTFAGLLATIGLGISAGLAGLGYGIAYVLQLPGFILANVIDAIGLVVAYLAGRLSDDAPTRIPAIFAGLSYAAEYPFAWLGFMLNETTQLSARTIYYFVNVLASVAGGAIGITGALAGSLMGLVIGALSSLQLLVTNNPYLTPTEFAFRAVLISACCEMDSVDQMRRLVANANQEQNFIIINSQDDEVIRVDAALSTGLGIKPVSTKVPVEENTPLTSAANRSVFWYTKGGHAGFLKPEFELPIQTFN